MDANEFLHDYTPFVKDAAERAAKSFVQGFAVGAGMLKLGSDVVANVDIIGFPWAAACSTGGGMLVASLVTSLLSFKAGTNGTASLTSAVQKSPRRRSDQ